MWKKMKRAIASLVIAAVVASVATVGMAVASLEQLTLWADNKNIAAGMVDVSADNENLIIQYSTIDGWELTAYHIYVGTNPPEKSAPGRFPYKAEDGSTECVIPLSEVGYGNMCIAAQAELQKPIFDPETGEQIYQEETGWAEGEPIRPGKNWAMYFEVFIPFA
jgi:hypothetical protein